MTTAVALGPINPRNPYLEGDYEPVAEEMEAFNLPVRGQVPPELSGLYLRNGPNPTSPIAQPYHWFSGDGMLHGIRLQDGKAAWYRNRWVRTARLVAKRGGTDPGGPPDTFPENPSNTSVLEHSGRILSMNEVGFPYEVDAELTTLGRFDFQGRLRTGMSAHAKVDPASGELLFYGYTFAPPFLVIYASNARGVLTKVVPVDIPQPVMMHDFAFTPNYIVILDLPVCFNLDGLATTGLPFTWKPEAGARVGILPRSSTKVRWIDVEPCYVLHTVNAYESGGSILLDLVRYDRMCASVSHGPWESLPNRLERWTIDVAAGRIGTTILHDEPQELPRINSRLAGANYRYAYTTGLRQSEGGTVGMGDLLKHDHLRGIVERHPLSESSQAGECVFVASPRAGAEDEGWILSLVYDRRRGASDLLIINAQDFGGSAVATVHLPQRVPSGFHGTWIPDSVSNA
jgi:carotenoid cleavage dioxygenase-like enzyme